MTNGSNGIADVPSTVFLATFQNIATAISTQISNATNIAGAQDFYNITSAKMIKPSAGRIVNISVIVPGSAVGTVYDAASISDTTRPIYKITFASTGIQVVNLPFQYGLLIVPGTGQTLAGSFS
jgi:hypothetical protein